MNTAKFSITKKRELLCWHIIDALIKFAEQTGQEKQSESYSHRRFYVTYKDFMIDGWLRADGKMQTVRVRIEPASKLNNFIDYWSKRKTYYATQVSIFEYQKSSWKKENKDENFETLCKTLLEITPGFGKAFLSLYDLFEKNG
jgi:hypothetical protein